MQDRSNIFLFTFKAEPSSPPLGALCDVDLLIVSHGGVEAEGGAGNSHHSRAGRQKEEFRFPLSLMVVVSSSNAGQTNIEDEYIHF